MTSPISLTVAPEQLALQRLYRWEREQPDRVVLTQPLGGGAVRDFTWAQAMDEVRRMAAHLRSLDFAPGSRIAILSKNCAHWMLADFAIWMAGHVSVPLYPTLAASTIRQILEHSESKLVFVGKLDGWDAMRTGIPDTLPCVGMPLAPSNNFVQWDKIVATTSPFEGHPVRDGDELSTIIYTSGTTGIPKGVMHSFASFAWSLSSGIRRAPLDGNARLISYLPLAHVVERGLVEHALLASSLHVYFAQSLDTFTADLQRARPTVFFSVPRLWVKFRQAVEAKMPTPTLHRLLRIPVVGRLVRRKILKALGLEACTHAIGGAAPMPLDLLNWYAQLGLPISEGYGMTENCAVSHATLAGVPRPGTVGLPYDGVESRIDPATGEVQMRSPGVMLGYYKEPELTRDAFTADGWLRTGDEGKLDAEGNLRITGRLKDLFKTSKGKYVSPAPIEDRLITHSAIEACVVVGASLGQPFGIVMLNPEAAKRATGTEGRAAIEASLTQHLANVNSRLDPHEQLSCIVVVAEPWSVENGFVTPTFKIKRNRIEAVYGPMFDAWTSARRPIFWNTDAVGNVAAAIEPVAAAA